MPLAVVTYVFELEKACGGRDFFLVGFEGDEETASFLIMVGLLFTWTHRFYFWTQLIDGSESRFEYFLSFFGATHRRLPIK